MCDSNASSSSCQHCWHPILIPDEIPGGVIRHECARAFSNLNAESENLPLLIDKGVNNIVPIENGRRKRKACDTAASCCISQMLSTSKSTTPMPISSNAFSSDPYIHSQRMNSTQHLSALQRMMDTEEVNRSVTNDHRALKDVDPSFHKQVWRERVAQWCYGVLDYLEESRDVAAVAMNIIDRYLAVLSKESSLSTPLVIGEFDYEVISFTALFLAIRVSGSNKELEISELLRLSSSSGAPQARHIVSAGNSILEKLSWNHQILTPNSFLRELVALLMIEFHEEEATTVKAMACESVSNLVEFAAYLVEVSVCDIYFSAVAPSKIAFGALALAMMCNSDLFSTGCRHKAFLSHFFRIVHELTSMNIECPQMNSILSRLLHVYNQSQEAVTGNFGRETIQWERSANNGTYQTSLPHIIVDEAEESNTTDEMIFSSDKSERLVALHNNGHRVNTNTSQTRPVSPLSYSFR
jgi:hypothetical protein